MKTRTGMITIKREIYTNDRFLMQFIDDNMEYRRRLYNKAVEYVRSNDHRCNMYALGTYLYNNKEKSDIYYNNYAIGVRANICRCVKKANDLVWKSRRDGKFNAKLRFTRYDKYHGSFKVENKSRKETKRTCTILDKNTIFYKGNKTKDHTGRQMFHFNVCLKEPICHHINKHGYMSDKHKRYKFSNSDIREIGFVKDIDKYYILITVEVTFNSKNGKHFKSKAGIDLGIHNPVTIYDGERSFTRAFDSKTLKKIKKLEKKCERLQAIMDRKWNYHKSRGIPKRYRYTKSYEKVRKKFRKTWRKIVNIRKDWRFKLTYAICNTYKELVVDTFKQPKNGTSTQFHKINHYNRLHAMYLFSDCLRYMSVKYYCYFNDAPKKTTRTCSNCGYENPKLPLSERMLVCENCGIEIDRDINAAINCYNAQYITVSI